MNAYSEEGSLDFDDVLDEWLLCVRPKLKPTTYAAYQTVLTRHIWPELSGKRPEEVGDEEIERFLSKKAGEGLSPSTLRSISCVLRAVIKYGKRYGCIADAEACKVTASRKRTSISILSDEERQRIVSALGEKPQGKALGVLISLYTGLRVGEICGLKWGDVSMDRRSLTVRRTVSRIRSDGKSKGRTRLYIGEPKSMDSCRRIPLPAAVTAALGGAGGGEDFFILSGSPDKIVEPRAMQRYFNKLLKETKIEHMNYHALRHSFATQCVDLGFDIKALSMILGHADVGLTLNTYVHPSFERMRSMMDMIK